MKRRTANKILNTSFHFEWYYNGYSLWSVAPKNPRLYFKAHRALSLKPYYDPAWLKLIGEFKRKYGTQKLRLTR